MKTLLFTVFACLMMPLVSFAQLEEPQKSPSQVQVVQNEEKLPQKDNWDFIEWKIKNKERVAQIEQKANNGIILTLEEETFLKILAKQRKRASDYIASRAKCKIIIDTPTFDPNIKDFVEADRQYQKEMALYWRSFGTPDNPCPLDKYSNEIFFAAKVDPTLLADRQPAMGGAGPFIARKLIEKGICKAICGRPETEKERIDAVRLHEELYREEQRKTETQNRENSGNDKGKDVGVKGDKDTEKEKDKDRSRTINRGDAKIN
jgi:hypothetical protein